MNPRREGDGWTPLHLAAMFGKCDVTQVLLEAGASSSIKGSDGKTAEDVAKQYRHHCLADILHRLAAMILSSSRGGLVVERLLYKKCHSAMVDQIPLGDHDI